MGNRARDGTGKKGKKGQKRSRKARMLETIDARAPWDAWVRIVDGHLPNKGPRGRPRIPTITMLRMLVIQRALNYSDRECEDECRENRSVSRFLGTEDVPDRTTLCKFRNLLASQGVLRRLFEFLVRLLEAEGKIKKGTSLVDATFIESPSSTKNRAHARDPDAHSAKKGNTWHFGYKAHAGADGHSGLVHTVITTAANVADIKIGKDCVRRDDEAAFMDAGYVGIEKREEAQEGGELAGKKLFVAAKRSTVKTEEQKFREHAVSSVRSPVEHLFHYLKDIILLRKTPYKGLQKNDEMVCLAFAIVDLLMLSRKRVSYFC